MASGEIDITPGRVLGGIEPVTARKLNDLGNPSLRIKESAIAARELADGTIARSKLDPAVEGQLAIADNAVTTNKILDGAVTTAKIAAGQIFDVPRIKSDNDVFTYKPGSVIFVDPVDQAYVIAPNWQDLYSIAIPAGLLKNNGDSVRVHFAYRTAGSCNGAKSSIIRVSGSAGYYDPKPDLSATFTWANWNVVLYIIRFGPAQQLAGCYQLGYTSTGIITDAFSPLYMNHSCDEEMTVVLYFSGPCNDCNADLAYMEFLPAP